MAEAESRRPKQDIKSILARIERPKKAVITAGMPYANGPLHIGHLAGALIPPDIHARFMRMLIGAENVLFVSGSDDHGSNAAVAAKKSGMNNAEFINEIHSKQSQTLKAYSISLDTYSGTSRAENFETHKNYCQSTLTKLFNNGMLTKKNTEQWYDSELDMFLPDRYVQGKCPNEACDNESAYSDDCDVCGRQYEPKELREPRSTVSDSVPVLKKTDHWWLDMWKVCDQLKDWVESRKKVWKKNVYNEVIGTISPCIIFSNVDEETYKIIKETLPVHKSRYAPGKMIVVQFLCLDDLEKGKKLLAESNIKSELLDAWAHRSITRDVAWGIPVPENLDPSMKGKTLYVWPESLVAPIAFTQLALKQKGLAPELFQDYWLDPESKIYQFVGQDNVFFYVVMQGAMWFGTQADPFRMPIKGELQLSDVFSVYHLQIDGKKMSKSTGNFYTADQLIGEMGYKPDQVRYFLALLSLSEKASNFDFENFKQRNQFLEGPLNASFEKPISAVHSKYDGKIPRGKLIGKTEKETIKIIQNYLRFMERTDYSKLLFAIENYTRIINSLFSQFKPHDDRFDAEQRANALYSCFYILKNVMIMLYPFVPETMNKLRISLNLPEEVFNIEELGSGMPENHLVGEIQKYF